MSIALCVTHQSTSARAIFVGALISLFASASVIAQKAPAPVVKPVAKAAAPTTKIVVPEKVTSVEGITE